MSRECNRVVVCTDGAGAARLGSRLIVLRQPRTFLGQHQPVYNTAWSPSYPKPTLRGICRHLSRFCPQGMILGVYEMHGPSFSHI
jgi:hypothetical protein